MKYGELIQFKPIASVITVQEADEQQKALELLDTYVMSDRMAREIQNYIVPHLQFEEMRDNRGLLIVGNYGTGKSHLMAVLSTVAENAELRTRLNHAGAADALIPIAGKFRVVRMELGGTQITLRDAVCKDVVRGLKTMGIDYQFPPITEITNNKESFLEMMGIFNEKFPDQGLLVVIDELLDFLRTRHQQELTLDLNFLRELGELATQSRFRIMAGTQEVLFGNAQFQFVADSMQRVASRFQEVHIVNDDVAFVVSHRILNKTMDQKSWIRSYLEPFSPLFESMALRLDQYVDLFPVNPDFFRTFEKINLGEKREILKTITEEMQDILNREIPKDNLELLSVDRYWDYLARNSAFNSNPDFQQLRQRVETAQDKIKSGMAQPAYVPLAIRMIKGLAIHRLTVGFDMRLGLTPKELKDTLALYIPVPMIDPAFLEKTIESILRDMTRILGHQLIIFNSENNQYFIDMGDYVDLDAVLQEKAAILDDDKLNQHYFDLLATILERKDPYVPGNRIWRLDVPWQSHHVERPGYLFFGTPNERTTAQPPREFYCYFLQPFSPPKYQDAGRDDEVFFRLAKVDEDFTDMIRHFAAARELSASYAKSSSTRSHFEEIADRTLKLATKWLKENFRTKFQVIHQSHPYAIRVSSAPDATVLELVSAVLSQYLEEAFERQLPGYPILQLNYAVTRANMRENVQHALRRIAGQSSSSIGTRILESLELMDGDKIRPRRSRYAAWILNLMESAAAPYHVVNRKEILTVQHTRDGVEDIAYTTEFHLEPALLQVILASLIWNGDAVVVMDRVKYGPERLGEFINLDDTQIAQLSHVEQPKGVSKSSIRALFEFFGLPRAYVDDESKWDDAVIPTLQSKVQDAIKLMVSYGQFCRQDIRFFGELLLAAPAQEHWLERIGRVKAFLEQVQNYNTVGKLRAFNRDAAEIDGLFDDYRAVGEELEQLKTQYEALSPLASYLDTAAQILPPDDAWHRELGEIREGFIDRLKTESANVLRAKLDTLRGHYVRLYRELHQRHRLNKAEDDRRQALIHSPEWQALDALSTMGIWIDGKDFQTVRGSLVNLKVCMRLSESDLKNQVECPYCHFKPLVETQFNKDLDWFESQISAIGKRWANTLGDALSDPSVQETLRLFDGGNREAIQSLAVNSTLPLPLPGGFVEDLKTVLQGIHATEISVKDVLAQLGEGTPLKPGEAKTRLEQILEHYLAGYDPNRVRIIFRN
ncbi:MAG: hypothetical protein C7B46_07770 [Sulfobacillus benefaciens]|uniref:ATPase n=1 Tax=Sulfobacillus benefaciens TaxID=453960 RepID=A0A2T2XHA1_9FIRM|nr:MAG: hypothetical protein C7B46_07770 [Sulfobacillus benefaciens]